MDSLDRYEQEDRKNTLSQRLRPFKDSSCNLYKPIGDTQNPINPSAALAGRFSFFTTQFIIFALLPYKNKCI